MVVYRATTPGLTLAERLGPILEEALRQLPIARRMRWRDLSAEFVGLSAGSVMIGAEVVPIELFGALASNQSRAIVLWAKAHSRYDHRSSTLRS